jgi:hypothetical protein
MVERHRVGAPTLLFFSVHLLEGSLHLPGEIWKVGLDKEGWDLWGLKGDKNIHAGVQKDTRKVALGV